MEKNGIPIWKELAKVYDTDIESVKALSKAHKLGVAEIKTALKNATAAYQGTAAALSGTTQGSKSSMEAAEALAFKGAADGYNDKMREYYQGRQAYFDALADDSQWRQDIQLVGEAEAQLELLWQEICDIASKIGNGALGVLGNVIDSLKGHTTAGEIEARRIGRGGEDLERLGKNMANFDATTAKNAFDALFKTLGDENKKLEEYTANWENSQADEREQWNRVIQAQRSYIEAIKDTAKGLGELANKAQAVADDEAAKAARRKNTGENLKLQEQAAMNGKDPDAIAAAHLFSSAGLLVQAFDDLDGKIKAHVALTDEEIETYKELEKPYQAIMKLRAEELGEYQKTLAGQKSLDDSLVSTAAALRAEDERRMQNGEDMRREYGASEAYNRAFDGLKRLADRLENTDLNGGEKASVMSKELARMLADARKNAITATQETLEARGLHSVKDFKFTDFEVDEKTLKIQEDIKRASEDANKILDEIALKLPSPTMAQ